MSRPPDLADAIDQAATARAPPSAPGTVDTASHRLHLDAGGRGTAEYTRSQGALRPDELADGLARGHDDAPPPVDTKDPVMKGVTYAAGALVAADHKDRGIWALTPDSSPEEVSELLWRGAIPDLCNAGLSIPHSTITWVAATATIGRW